MDSSLEHLGIGGVDHTHTKTVKGNGTHVAERARGHCGARRAVALVEGAEVAVAVARSFSDYELRCGCRNVRGEHLIACNRAPRHILKRLDRKGLRWSRRSDSN